MKRQFKYPKHFEEQKKIPFLMFLNLRGIKLGEELQTLLRYDLYFILLIVRQTENYTTKHSNK